MRKIGVVIALALVVSLAGCAGLAGDLSDGASDAPDNESVVAAENRTANAESVEQTVRVEVNESVAGSEWESVSVTYPRGDFTVDGAKHGAVALGVDSDGDGEIDREFDEANVSGVNNNEYSFTVGLDTDYTLRTGEVVVVEYPGVNNPAESGEYEISVTLNDAQTTTGTVTIEA